MIRDKCASGNWGEFDKLLEKTEAGNSGNIGKFEPYRYAYLSVTSLSRYLLY